MHSLWLVYFTWFVSRVAGKRDLDIDEPGAPTVNQFVFVLSHACLSLHLSMSIYTKFLVVSRFVNFQPLILQFPCSFCNWCFRFYYHLLSLLLQLFCHFCGFPGSLTTHAPICFQLVESKVKTWKCEYKLIYQAKATLIRAFSIQHD